MVGRSGSLLLFGAVGVAAYFFLAPRFPKDQSVNVVLGDAARDVTDVAVRYGSLTNGDDDLARDVAFHYALGAAPRIVHHDARLPDGEYVVAIEVRGSSRTWTDSRRVHLEGGSTSIDVSARARAALEDSRGGDRDRGAQ